MARALAELVAGRVLDLIPTTEADLRERADAATRIHLELGARRTCVDAYARRVGAAFELSVNGEQIWSKLETKPYQELKLLTDAITAEVAPA
jgi:hypothetical protein